MAPQRQGLIMLRLPRLNRFFTLLWAAPQNTQKLQVSKQLAAKKSLQEMLERWEYATCKGSECYQRHDFRSAIMYFEVALSNAQDGLKQNSNCKTFLRYYTLANMNLAHALTSYKKNKHE